MPAFIANPIEAAYMAILCRASARDETMSPEFERRNASRRLAWKVLRCRQSMGKFPMQVQRVVSHMSRDSTRCRRLSVGRHSAARRCGVPVDQPGAAWARLAGMSPGTRGRRRGPAENVGAFVVAVLLPTRSASGFPSGAIPWRASPVAKVNDDGERNNAFRDAPQRGSDSVLVRSQVVRHTQTRAGPRQRAVAQYMLAAEFDRWLQHHRGVSLGAHVFPPCDSGRAGDRRSVDGRQSWRPAPTTWLRLGRGARGLLHGDRCRRSGGLGGPER